MTYSAFRPIRFLLPIMGFALFSAGCTQSTVNHDADVIVVGAGIAGLAAALEAAERGARVIIVEANSVGGGHAVKAGGFALVDTELQRSKGIADSPDIAFADLLRWGVDPDPYWADRYTKESASEVYDWLTELGVEFAMILDTPEDTVPRFHFTRGTAVNAVVPMLRKVIYNLNIEIVWNTRVTALAKTRGAITGVYTTNERDGTKQRFRAPTVILTTGGFQNNLQLVQDNWPTDRPWPRRVLAGAGEYATGDGYRLAEWAGAEMRWLDKQVTFYDGIPDPRDSQGYRGLLAQNPSAIWVDSAGRRFINEGSDSKEVAATVSQLNPVGYWMLFDATGAKRFSFRDAQLNRDEILNNPTIVKQADNLADLALKTGLPFHGLTTTTQTWNRMIELGEDFRFGRFGPGKRPQGIRALRTPPFFAVRMYPMTRKSMGGPAINNRAQVITNAGTTVPGLYAAGELTGVAGINGSHGGSGTFLGPSVLTGRIAGRAAAEDSAGPEPLNRSYAKYSPHTVSITAEPNLPGYWHYSAVHSVVAERGFECAQCHATPVTKPPSADRAVMLARLDTCTRCH